MTQIQDHDLLLEVECLDCGATRFVRGLDSGRIGACAACGYLGWALASDVSDAELHTLQLLHLTTAA